MMFTDFKGIKEMGIICGGGLIICLIPMLTMLPVLLLRGQQNVIDHVQGDPSDRRARIENFWLRRPVWVAVVTLAWCVLSATQLPKFHFDYNLLNMQSEGLPAVETEHKLINSAAKSVLFAAVIATNLQHAAELEQRIKVLPSVFEVDSMTRFMNEDQSRKLEKIREIKRDLAPLRFLEPDRAPGSGSRHTVDEPPRSGRHPPPAHARRSRSQQPETRRLSASLLRRHWLHLRRA
jgi:predicted RND superfamily exporter protein